jgi:hypothetical protein
LAVGIVVLALLQFELQLCAQLRQLGPLLALGGVQQPLAAHERQFGPGIFALTRKSHFAQLRILIVMQMNEWHQITGRCGRKFNCHFNEIHNGLVP